MEVPIGCATSGARLSGRQGGLVEWVSSLRVHPTIILIAMFVMLLIMGMFMDQVSIMMLTIPFLSLWRSP
ncbi:MAG: hypothetical protein QGG48_06480 [Desulfatiglandales bacterium]|nr:hypothetical protein [Desulfatiglandales bacterium]